MTESLQVDATPALMQQPRFFQPASVEAGQRQPEHRFAIKSSPLSTQPITYEFTDDKALLHQYYLMRQQMLNKAWGVDYVKTLEDKFDSIAHTMIARQDKLVVGGFRIIVRDVGEDFNLPMEIKGFDLRDALPELKLRECAHAEISRFAVLPDYREEEILLQFITRVIKKCIQLNLDYSFCFSQKHRSRMWRKLVNASGLIHAYISDNVFPPVPDICGDMKYYLTIFEHAKLDKADAFALHNAFMNNPLLMPAHA